MKKKLILLLDQTASMSDWHTETSNGMRNLAQIVSTSDFDFEGRTFVNYLKEHKYTADEMANLWTGGGPTGISTSVEKLISELMSRPNVSEQGHLVVIVTDGKDDLYREDLAETIREAVQVSEQSWRWDWLFIGTDSDAIKYSAKLGIKPGKTLRMENSNQGYTAALHSLLDIVQQWSADQISGDNFFTDEDRARQEKTVTRKSGLL